MKISKNINFSTDAVLIDEVLKESSIETTKKIYFSTNDGKTIGPFVEKTINLDYGTGSIYKFLWEENQNCTAYSNKYIPQIYNVKKDKNKLLIYEEFLDGKSLDKFIEMLEFDINIFYDIVFQLCDCVNFLHNGLSKTIIHKDIKPSNLFVLTDNNKIQLKIIDFGISREYNPQQNFDTKKYGTLGYASPEHFGYTQTDQRSDIFSVGKVIEFLLNINNWKSDTKNQINNIKFSLEKIVNTACAIDPKNRYKNIASLKQKISQTQIATYYKPKFNNNFFKSLCWIWNVIISLITAGEIILLLYLLFSEQNENNFHFSGQSTPARIAYTIMFIFFIFVPVWYLLLFKKPIKK